MVWALAISTTVAYGVLYYSFAVFVKPMELELGWDRAQTAGAFSLSTLVAGLVAPLLGRVLDKRGARVIMTIGAISASAVLLLWSFTVSLGMLYPTFFLLGVCAACTFYDPAFTAIAVWFRVHRARAMLLITLVAGLASTIFVPLDTWLLEQLGWRDAVRVLAGLMLLTALPLWLFVRRHPHDVGQTVDGLPEQHVSSQALSDSSPNHWLASSAFWSVALSFAFARTAVATLAPHLVPLLLERGYSRAVAAFTAAGVGVLQLVGRVFFTSITSRSQLVLVSSATFAVHGAGVLALALTPSQVGLWAFVLLYGATNGAITLTRAALVAEIFGSSQYGRVNGAISFTVAISSALMPLLAGVLHNQSGNYQTTLWLLVVLLGVSTALVLGAQKERG
jgi:MFS family permease